MPLASKLSPTLGALGLVGVILSVRVVSVWAPGWGCGDGDSGILPAWASAGCDRNR